MALLRNARLPDGSIVDISVSDGQITGLSPSAVAAGQAAVNAPAPGDVDLGGWLTLPALAEPHAHLDKAFTAEVVPNPAGDLMGAIGAWNEAVAEGRLAPDDTTARATAALEQLATRGVGFVRSHVNVGADEGLTPLKAVQRAVAAVKGVIDVELVALLHPPLAGPASHENRRLLDAAIEAGVDVVGGCPHLEPDPAAMIDHILTVAVDAGLPVDLHVDETLDPTMLTLRRLATAVIDRGVEQSVVASHCVSLGMQPPSTQQEIAALVAEAGIGIVALPQTNLFLQGRDHAAAIPRGLTAVRALQDAGATVIAGGDNVQDPFNLVGRNDPFETAALMVMAAHVSPDDALAMVSGSVHQATSGVRRTLDIGAPADLLVIDAASPREAISSAPMSRRLIKGGAVVAHSVESAGLGPAPTI